MEVVKNEIRKLVKVSSRGICFDKPCFGLFLQQLLVFIYCFCWAELSAIRIYQLVPNNGCVKEIWSKRINILFFLKKCYPSLPKKMTNDAEKFIKFCESDFGKRVLEKEAEYVYQELKGSHRILDVGCGIGQFEQKLSELNITGLDNSKEILEEARKRSNKTFVLGDAESLSFDNASFDAVFYVATLEFVDSYRKAIQEAY